jgi:hypothetical protein
MLRSGFAMIGRVYATRTTSAELYYPFGVALEASRNIYIADTQNNRVRMVCAGTTSPTHGTTCPAAGDIRLTCG